MKPPITGLIALALAAPAPAQMPHGAHDAMPMHRMPMGHAAMDALMKQTGKTFNIAFMSQMIAHHQGAIEMSRDVLNTQADPRIKTMARKIIKSQQGEIKKMTSWLKAWYGVTPSKFHMNLVQQDQKAMMAMPVNSGRAYAEMMIPHHQEATRMAKMVLQKSDKAPLKGLARKMIQEQTKETNDFQRLLRAGAK